MESLEARDVPALILWLNQYGAGDGQFDNPLNWREGVVPGAGDAVVFSGSEGASSDSCYGMAGTFKSISLHNSYSGTVTLSGSVLTGDLYVDTGTLDQPGPSTDITVTGTFEWHAGTINSTSNAASLTVDGSTDGATALVEPWGAPWGNWAVSTGSTLNFVSGATATFYPGTVTFTGGDGINIVDSSASCQPPAQPPAPGAPIPPASVVFDATLKQVNVTNAPFTINYNLNSGMPLLNSGGTVTVDSGFTAEFKGIVSSNAYQFVSSVGQISGGTTRINGNGILKAKDGVYLGSGKLTTGAVAGVPGPARIIGNLRNAGADIVIYDTPGVQGNSFGTLQVTGSMDWTGGTYRPHVNVTQGSIQADLLEVTGTITVNGAGSNGAKYGPIMVNLLPGGTVAAGRTWQVMKSSDPIQIAPGGQDVGFDLPNEWASDLSNGNREVFLRRR